MVMLGDLGPWQLMNFEILQDWRQVQLAVLIGLYFQVILEIFETDRAKARQNSGQCTNPCTNKRSRRTRPLTSPDLSLKRLGPLAFVFGTTFVGFPYRDSACGSHLFTPNS